TLIDADPLGGGADLLVEAPVRDGLRWQEATGLGPDDGEALRAGLPRVDAVHLLVAGEGPGPTEQSLPPVLSALAVLDGTVVVDLGPALVPAAAEHLDRLLVVVPSSDHAVRATQRRLGTWQPPGDLAHAVVRRSGPLGPGEVCADLGLPLAVSFRDSPRGTVPLLDVRRRGSDRAARATQRGLGTWQPPGDLAHAVVRRSGPLGPGEVCADLGLPLAVSFRDSARGTVPLLDVRRRGADRAARELMARLGAGPNGAR